MKQKSAKPIYKTSLRSSLLKRAYITKIINSLRLFLEKKKQKKRARPRKESSLRSLLLKKMSFKRFELSKRLKNICDWRFYDNK